MKIEFCLVACDRAVDFSSNYVRKKRADTIVIKLLHFQHTHVINGCIVSSSQVALFKLNRRKKKKENKKEAEFSK